MIQDLKIADIRLDGNTQARVAIHQTTVDEYAEVLTAGGELPPIVVFFDGAAHWIADGFHRLHAHRSIGAVTARADVRDGTSREAQMHAYGANQAHGLRRTNDDKRKAVDGMLALVPDWSDRAIAKHVGVAHTMVAAVRNPEVAERQQDARKKAPAKTMKAVGVESDSTLPAAEPPSKQADREPGPVRSSTAAPETTKTEAEQTQEDAHGGTDLVDELERTYAENKSLHEQIAAMSADDQKAETLKWRRAYDNAVRQQSEAMDRAKLSTDREAWTMRQLRRCGKAIGQDDPSKIAAAIEAFMREHKKVAA